MSSTDGEVMAEPVNLTEKDNVGRRLYSKRDTLILAFSFLALAEGTEAFVFTLSFTVRNYSPFQSFPFWYIYNPTLGMSPLTLFADLVFPALLFVMLYSIGDRIMLKDNLLQLSMAMVLGGLLGFASGYVIGAAAFVPGGPSLWDVLVQVDGIAALAFRGFEAFVVGFSAVLLKQLRTKAVWIV